MASERDFELLDQYLGNRMSAHDKAVFEQKLEADGELKKEFRLQQRVVEGIRKTRASELKKMLNDVPLTSLPSEGTSMVAQIGIWVFVAGIVGTGLYFFLKPVGPTPDPEPAVSEVIEQKQPQIEEPKAQESVGEEVPVKEEALVQKEELTPSQAKSKAKPESKAVVKKPAPTEKEDVKPATRAPLDVFDPTEEIEKAAAEDSGEKDKSAVSTAPSIAVETVNDKRYTFHYQFKSGKLYLYGAFEKNLYEIMEFFSDNKRTMFLFYKDNYYLLNEGTDKVKPLAPIADANLLKKLKDYRGN